MKRKKWELPLIFVMILALAFLTRIAIEMAKKNRGKYQPKQEQEYESPGTGFEVPDETKWFANDGTEFTTDTIWLKLLSYDNGWYYGMFVREGMLLDDGFYGEYSTTFYVFEKGDTVEYKDLSKFDMFLTKKR